MRPVGRAFRTLEVLSFLHSATFAALLGCWLGGADPALIAIFGWLHGGGWIAMSLACIVAARRHIVPFWLAVTVAVIGGVGPFAGSIGFVIADRRAPRAEPA